LLKRGGGKGRGNIGGVGYRIAHGLSSPTTGRMRRERTGPNRLTVLLRPVEKEWTKWVKT